MAAAATVPDEDRKADPDSGGEEFSGCRTDGSSSSSGTRKNGYVTSKFCVFFDKISIVLGRGGEKGHDYRHQKS